MKNTFLENIIRNKKVCYFVSPHFDDAILSAGALMNYLSEFTDVVVINVFTEAESKHTLSARAYLRQCGYNDANKLFKDRKNEDKEVLRSITKKIINLGFTDALWRRKSKHNVLSQMFGGIEELSVVYPTYRFHITRGKIARADIGTVSNIKKMLAQHIANKNSAVFCPLGIGNHVDHLIVRKVCERLSAKPIYWSDFPYNKNEKFEVEKFNSFTFDQKQNEKKKMIKGYKSQFSAMFAKGLEVKSEKFYYDLHSYSSSEAY